MLSSLYALALLGYGILVKFRPDLVSKVHRTPTVAALLSFRSWVILALVIVIILLLEGAYRVIAKRDKELAEAKAKPEYKLFLEVDIKPRIDRMGVKYSGVDVATEDHVKLGPDDKYVPIGHLFLVANLWVRFDNRDDVVHSRVEGITVTLKCKDKTIPLEKDVIGPDGQSHDLRNYIHVPAGTVTDYYRLNCSGPLDKSMKAELDEQCLLHIEMEAIKQEPYCVDLAVDWDKTLINKERAGVEVCRVGAC